MKKEITRAEFYEKYGDVEVTFSSYYKYTFEYSATLDDGKRIVVSYGGNSDEVYRHEVSSGFTETINALGPYAGNVYADGNCIEGFYDY
jgi:hypothetical protein